MAEISVTEARSLLNLSRTWVIKLIERGALKGRKVGSYYVLDEDSVLEYKAQKEAEQKN